MLELRIPPPWRMGHARAARMGFCACAAVLAASALADTAPVDESQGPLQEITVTATRHEESLSKVPISVTALTQDAMDIRGIKDFQDIVHFTPGVNIDTSGTNNIAIRGIASSGGAGTTGIYIDDTPIQIRATAFNPDDALPKTFDIDRVEVLRGPQGTLFGSGSEGGTVRYITTQPSLTTNSFYGREEVSYTESGSISYEGGIAAGGPLIEDKLGARLTVWYRRDGGYIDNIDPVTLDTVQKNANYDETVLYRLGIIWAPTDQWTVTPSIYYQDRYRNNVEDYWPLLSNPGNNQLVSADPDERSDPDRFYLAAVKMEGNLGFAKLISNTSYYHRDETTGYEGTLYNLGFYQRGVFINTNPDGTTTPASMPYPLLDGTCQAGSCGLHLPPGALNYRSPNSIDNHQQNIAQEIRLQSADADSKLFWTTGVFFSEDRQTYLEQIHDPLLNELSLAATGQPYTYWFTDPNTGLPVLYDPSYPNDSYFLQTRAVDKQYAVFTEGTYSFTDQYKLTLGARYSWTKFSNDSYTGGPQLFLPPQSVDVGQSENSFTPKVSFSFQEDPQNLYYATYAKGFRPGGANNPVPQAACAQDFASFGITQAPPTFSSDTVNSFEVGAKNNIDNRVKIASSIYYIRWNNIQQTVVPPICQISFIDNLGTAVAKGADIQADIALTDALTAEIATGYTSARYTKNSVLSSTQVTPIVSSGDAIVGNSGEPPGQPGAPFTATVGLEYKFMLFNRQSFIRVDDEYESRNPWLSPSQDPSTLQYDPQDYTLPATNFASARAGMNFAGWQVAAFVDNLTDSHTVTAYNWTINPNPPGVDTISRLQRDYTFRPRTIGLTITYRN
ncbi:MAG: TonB-dependent receptor [Steroidobacteraceae bacterium]